MDIMTHAKFYFNRLMLTLIFTIWASEPPPGPGKRLKGPGLIGLTVIPVAEIDGKRPLLSRTLILDIIPAKLSFKVQMKWFIFYCV